MKKGLSFLFVAFISVFTVFAQTDLKVVALVKLNKTESITLKQVRNRVEAYEKQRGASLSLDDRRKVLDAMIQEKLVLQAAQKAGITVPDSAVDQQFLQTVTQQREVTLTQAEVEKHVQEQMNMSLEQYVREASGMSVAELKSMLKNNLITQQYVISQKGAEISSSAAPTDEEIRSYYELNKASFVWTDMAKIFIVIVPKGSSVEKARVKANDLCVGLKDKKLSIKQITVDAKKDNSGFQAGEMIINKNQMTVQQLGFSYQQLLDLFSQDKGYTSTVQETEDSFNFFQLVKKYDAKMLGLSDIVQPETTITVYDYIKNALAQRKQVQALAQAAQDLYASLETSDNVERKMKGEALDKLLSW